MTIVKKHSQNNMLFMLASLACGQSDSSSAVSSTKKQPTPRIAAVSDISDDDISTITIETSPKAKDLVVARRRRRPIKKRIPTADYRPSASPLFFLGSSIKPRKSLLETGIDVVSNSSETKQDITGPVEWRDQQAVPAAEDDATNSDESPETDEEMPALVPDDDAWKKVHSPLVLPNYLPCPAMALKDVQSISLKLEERIMEIDLTLDERSED